MNISALAFLILPLLTACSTAGTVGTRQVAGETAGEVSMTTEIRCGVRFGTGGEASLVNSFNDVFTLAVQGGDQSLLDQLDKFIPNGSQLGQRYCVKVQFESNVPRTIIEAAEVKEVCGYRYGNGREASLVLSHKNPEPLVDLDRRAGNKTLLRQLDSFIAGGSKVGTKYCVEGRVDNRNTVIEILGAREY